MLRITIALLLVAGVASAEDSPLVALAKRTNRKASKTPVITNQNVGRGRVAIPTGDAPPAVTPAPATTPTAAAPAAPALPAWLLESPRPAAPPVPELSSTARSVAPQSSAQTTMATTSARNVAPTSGAVNYAPQSTAGSVAPASTAQNVQPPK